MNVRDAIALAAHVVGKGAASPLPILAYMRIANGRIIATDTSQQIDIPEALPGLGRADFCVHAGRFLKVLNALPADLELKLAHKGKALAIAAGSTRYELQTLPPEDYPAMESEGDKVVQFEVESKPFVEALKFAACAAAVNDIRYYLNGVHFQLAGRRLVFTGTDGYRLHRSRIEVEDAEVKDKAEGIIARQSIARVIEVADRHSTVNIDASTTRFNVTDKETLWTKLIDGKFPEAERVIPSDRPSTGGIRREAFAAAVRRVAQIFAGDKVQGIRFTFEPDSVLMEATNTEHDKAEERFAWNAADQKFTRLELAMAWEYVVDALDSLQGDNVFLHLAGQPTESFYMTDGGAREAVIMPVRI